MRITIDLPENLVEEAKKLTRSGTKAEVIKLALENIIQKHKISKLKDFRGTVDLDLDLDSLRDRK